MSAYCTFEGRRGGLVRYVDLFFSHGGVDLGVIYFWETVGDGGEGRRTCPFCGPLFLGTSMVCCELLW